MLDQLPQVLASGLLLAAMYAIVALGLTLIFGVLDVVNFSHGQLIGLGAYFTYELVTRGLTFWLAVPVVMVALSLTGVAMEQLTFRPVRAIPINGLLVSIGWIAILHNVVESLWGPNQYTVTSALSGSFRVGGAIVAKSQALVLFAALVVMATLTVTLRYTSLGKALRATAQNREAAALLGIRTRRIDALAFAIGAGLAGLAGGLVVNAFPVTPGIGDSYMVYAFVALIVGGAGSAGGAVAGSAIVGVAVSVSQTYASTAVANVAPFIVLIVVLFFRPLGLFKTDYEASL